MPQRLFITGGEGFVAREIAECLADTFEITAAGKAKCDVLDPAQIAGSFSETKPNIVVHLAAWVDKAKCERFPGTARGINAGGARNVAEICRRSGVRLVYISSDFVFDGRKNTPYVETDEPNPLNVYGASKLEGERAVAEFCPDAMIVRTSRLFGKYGHSFISILPVLMKTEKRLQVVNDMTSSITYAPDFARALGSLIGNNAAGLFHVANAGECTVGEYAEAIKELLGTNAELEPVSWSRVMPDVAAPAYCTLGSIRAADAPAKLRNWKDTLSEFLGASSHV